MSEPRSPYGRTSSDDISLSALVSGIARSIRDMLRHWKGLMLCSILATSLLVFWQRYQQPVYTASLSFILSDDNNNQFSGMSAVLGQLGIPISSGKYNVDKLLEIARRRKIIQATLFDHVVIDGTEDFLANHLIRIYDLSEKWSSDRQEMSDFRFRHAVTDSFTLAENIALKNVYQLIVGKENGDKHALFQYDYGREDYIMYLSVSSRHPDLSIAFTNHLYDDLAAFFSDNASNKQQETYQLLIAKRDSLSLALSQLNTALAAAQDRTLGSVDNSSSARISRLQSDKFMLQNGLAKAEENLNIAEIANRTAGPLIQLLDRPLPPIKPASVSVLRTLMMGIFSGVVLYVAYQFIGLIMQTR